MRLATIQTPHGPRAAVQTADGYVDLHATDSSVPQAVCAFFAAGPAAAARRRAAPQARRGQKYQAAEAKLLAPVPDPARSSASA